MADKMLRIAGRGDDGTAKAIKTDDKGFLKVIGDKVNRIELIKTAVTLNPNETHIINNIEAFELFKIEGYLLPSTATSIQIRFEHTINGGSIENEVITETLINNRFYTKPRTSNTSSLRIIITNTNEVTITIDKLNLISVKYYMKKELEDIKKELEKNKKDKVSIVKVIEVNTTIAVGGSLTINNIEPFELFKIEGFLRTAQPDITIQIDYIINGGAIITENLKLTTINSRFLSSKKDAKTSILRFIIKNTSTTEMIIGSLNLVSAKKNIAGLNKKTVLADSITVNAESERVLVTDFEFNDNVTAWGFNALETNRPFNNIIEDLVFIIEFSTTAGNYNLGTGGGLVFKQTILFSDTYEIGKGLAFPITPGEVGTNLILQSQYFNVPSAKYMRITAKNTRTSNMRLQKPTIIQEGNFDDI